MYILTGRPFFRWSTVTTLGLWLPSDFFSKADNIL